MSHRPSALASGLALACLACAAGARVSAYRLAGSGTHWDTVDDDRVLQDLRPRYPEFFELVLDPADTRDPDLRRRRQRDFAGKRLRCRRRCGVRREAGGEQHRQASTDHLCHLASSPTGLVAHS